MRARSDAHADYRAFAASPGVGLYLRSKSPPFCPRSRQQSPSATSRHKSGAPKLIRPRPLPRTTWASIGKPAHASCSRVDALTIVKFDKDDAWLITPHPQARIRRPHDRHAGRSARRQRAAWQCRSRRPADRGDPAFPGPLLGANCAASITANPVDMCAIDELTGRAISPAIGHASARTGRAMAHSPWSVLGP